MNRSLLLPAVAAAAVAVCAPVLPTLAQPASAQPAPASDSAGVEAVIRASAAALGVEALPNVHTLHVRGAFQIAGFTGSAEGWQDVRDGRFSQSGQAGPIGGGQGYDGTVIWNRDQTGLVWDDGGAAARYGNIDAVYINRYALWLPGRGGATVTAGEPRTDGATRFDVLHITPPGGLPFDLWVDAATHLPARVVARIGAITSTTTVSDYRDVHGLKIPFVQTSDTDGNVTTVRAASVGVDDPGSAAGLARPASHVTDASLPGGATTVPFELVDNHVALSATIDGKGPYTFLFDTGGQNIIDSGLAKELNLGNAGSMAGGGVGSTTEQFAFGTVDALRIGDATLRNQLFIVAPVRAGFGISSGKPVDGLIGWEVLARFVTTFDYGRNTVTLRTPASAASAPPAGVTTPFVFNGTHVQVPCTIDAFAGDCILDTGSRIGLSVDSPFIAAHPSIVPANATAVGANGFGVGGAALGRLGRTTLSVGSFTIPDVISDLSTQTKGAFADPFLAGNIGGAVWKRFVLTLDYPRRMLTLSPDANAAVRDTYDRSGIFLIAQGGNVLAADVRPGTPAAQAGLARGDILKTVGGKDAAALGLGAIRDLFRGAPGTSIPLGVAGKDGTVRTVTLTLRDYV